MNHLSIRLMLAGSLLAIACAAFAQAPQQLAPSPKALALARRYVADAQAERILSDEGQPVAQFMLSKIPEPPGGEAKANEVRQAMLDAADAAVKAKMPEFLEKTAVIYAQIFSEKELSDIVGFYDSPSGRIFIAKTGEAAGPMAELIHSLGEGIQADTQARFCAKEPESCKAAAAAAASAKPTR